MSLNQPFFSFVLPAYKAPFLKEAIESILNQAYKDFELIIVNDASPENLDIVVNSFKDKRIRYYKNPENIGGRNLVENWNHCISYAVGEYTILASDDDVYAPFFLDEVKKLIQRYPECSLFRGKVQLIDEKNSTLRQETDFPERMQQIEFIRAWYHSSFQFIKCIANYAFKTPSLQSEKFINFPLGWGSDDATIFTHSKNGIAITPIISFSFRISSINITNQKENPAIELSKTLARFEFISFMNRFIQQRSNNPQYKEIKKIHQQFTFNEIFYNTIRNKEKRKLYFSSKIKQPLWKKVFYLFIFFLYKIKKTLFPS